MNDLTKGENRLDKNISKMLVQSITRHIQWLEKDLQKIEGIIQNHLKEHHTLKEKVNLITSIPGAGCITACAILN